MRVSTKKTFGMPTFHLSWRGMLSTWLLGAVVGVAPVGAKAEVVEYFNRDLNNFFITADPTEQAFVDSGAVGRWQRTGNAFAAGGSNQVCRFYGNTTINPATGGIFGPNSHFYTADPVECAGLKAQYAPTTKSWNFESNDFLTTPPVAGTCASGLVPVYRAYNNGFARGVDSNHRITGSIAAYQQTVAAGSIGEGIVMCAPPPAANPTLLLSPDGTTVHDVANNISWLADFNLPASNRFGLPLCTQTSDRKGCVNAGGAMSYQAAVVWVDAMNAANYLGHNSWQLPTSPTLDGGCSRTGPNGNNFGFGCAASAYGYLYYKAFGFAAPATVVPIPSNAVGPFINFQPYQYWSQSNTSGNGYSTFSFSTGWVGSNTAPNFIYVLPMIAGKLAGTPTATGSGLQVNPGGLTVYDPMTNITWLANANIAADNTFGLPRCIDPTTPTLCVQQDGAMSLDTAAQLVVNVNSGVGYLDQKNWELPSISASCTNYNCAGTANPMGNLYYTQLGVGFGRAVIAAPDIDVGPFNDIQPYLYWTCHGETIQGPCLGNPAPNFQDSFSFGNGFKGTDILANGLYVTAYFVGPPTR